MTNPLPPEILKRAMAMCDIPGGVLGRCNCNGGQRENLLPADICHKMTCLTCGASYRIMLANE